MLDRILDINNASLRWYLALGSVLLVADWFDIGLISNFNLDRQSILGFLMLSLLLKIYQHSRSYKKININLSALNFRWLIAPLIVLTVFIGQDATRSLIKIFEEVGFSLIAIYGVLIFFSYLLLKTAQTKQDEFL